MDLCEWIMSLNFEVFLYNFCKLIISISIIAHIVELLCDMIIGKFIDIDKDTEESKSDIITNIVILAILTIFMIIILIRY
jgi:hypothetical protein